MKLGKKKKKRYNVEVGFLSKLIETQDMKLVKDMQIKSMFFVGENRRVFNFIEKQYYETGDFPTARVLEQKFPSFDYETHEVDGEEVIGNEESLMHWCKEIRMKTIHNTLAETTEKIADLLDDDATDKAKELFESIFYKIEGDIEIRESTDITKNTEERKKRYLERKNNKGVIGIPTGIEPLDRILRGLVDDTLTTIIAKTGVGKTFLLVLIGAYAMLNNYKVLVFVTEMSREQMEDRFDAVLFGFMYNGFSYNAFKSGTLSPEEEKEYFDFLDNDMTKMEHLIIEDASDVGGIIASVRREKPDLVLVDSAYLMDDMSKTDSDWLRVAHITRSLKKDVAKRFHLPVAINSQADKSTSKKTGPALDNISFSQAIGQDSDNVIAMYRDEIMYEENEMGLKALKTREGLTGKCTLNWDFKRMNFDTIYGEVSEDAGENGKLDSSEDLSDNILSIDE